MKTVKLTFACTGNYYNPEQNLIVDVLRNFGYHVVITDSDADFVICDVLGEEFYDYCKFPQVRVMYSGENYIPDFNLIDYAISPYPISFGDRHFQLPPCAWPRDHWWALAQKDPSAYTMDFVKSKPFFANFIASHESEYNIRGDFFKKLCDYKRVEAPGSYLNNMPGGATVDWKTSDKTDFQRKCKFTLCFESTNHYGFVTEKIMDAFYADTIPVYYGSPTVKDIFNPDAFINCGDFSSFDEAIARIRELDADDEAYLAMLRQPKLRNPNYPARLDETLGQYICHIFEQSPEEAYRRSRVYRPKYCDEYLARAIDSESLTAKNMVGRLAKKVFRRGGNS